MILARGAVDDTQVGMPTESGYACRTRSETTLNDPCDDKVQRTFTTLTHALSQCCLVIVGVAVEIEFERRRGWRSGGTLRYSCCGSRRGRRRRGAGLCSHLLLLLRHGCVLMLWCRRRWLSRFAGLHIAWASLWHLLSVTTITGDVPLLIAQHLTAGHLAQTSRSEHTFRRVEKVRPA